VPGPETSGPRSRHVSMMRPMSGGRTSARRRIAGQTAAAHADMSRTATVRRDNKGARTRSATKPRRAGVAHAQRTIEAVRSRRRSRAFRRASAKASTSATTPTARAPSTYRYTSQGPGTGGMAGAITGCQGGARDHPRAVRPWVAQDSGSMRCGDLSAPRDLRTNIPLGRAGPSDPRRGLEVLGSPRPSTVAGKARTEGRP
jgi:hypothetical protein